MHDDPLATRFAGPQNFPVQVGYYQSKLLDPKRHLVIKISNGPPRWGAKPEAELPELYPPIELVNAGLSEADFAERYLAHLERIGFTTIAAQLATIQTLARESNREPILCCFESLKTPGQYCHRTIFAAWFQRQTGIAIPELRAQPSLAL